MSDAPNTDPPFFWRRVWAGDTALDEVTVFTQAPDGSMVITLGVPQALAPTDAVVLDDPIEHGLVIYGRAINPPADAAYVKEQAERGQVFSECFSVAAPGGEVGCHPLAAVSEITRAEYDGARGRGWT